MISATAIILIYTVTLLYAEDLELAAYKGQKQKVMEILRQKPDTGHRDSFGGTALHAAMFQKDVSIIVMLLDYGFDPNAKGLKNGYTPLHDAVWASNIDAIRILLERGANPSIKNIDGITAYTFAIRSGKTGIAGYIRSCAEKKGLTYR